MHVTWLSFLCFLSSLTFLGRGGRGRGGPHRGGLLPSYGSEREAAAGDAHSSSGVNGAATSSAVAPPRFPSYRPRAGLLPGIYEKIL